MQYRVISADNHIIEPPNLFIDREGNYIGYGPEARELVGIPEPVR